MDDVLIDCLQYANWSGKVFEEMRDAHIDAVHVTIAYHEGFRDTVLNLEKWHQYFQDYSDHIFQGFYAEDVRLAKETGRTSIFLGFQNPSPIEDDIRLLEVWQKLGIRFMQLTYNNQSLLASGCYEKQDTGLTRMGLEVVEEMNRLGMVIDMSHSGEKSTLQVIETSNRPVAITHANPSWWHSALRNKSDKVLKALSQTGGMIGFSLYPHHLKNGSLCSLEDFCGMICKTADMIGVENIGIGSDLCQDQPNSIVEWMRAGRWTKKIDYGEGSASNAGFPVMPDFYKDNTDFPNLQVGLKKLGMNNDDISKVMGGNWLRFFENSFTLKSK
ncbi:MAG: membrane dipeptidase [Paracoccaceae bacterium]|nr:membrane dipeptidase [Paracoccaceae bacterium]|tara:strand:- start:65 stop:1051 length:987 start_codon:yes stop_codon:yes gene_type:complete